MHKQQFGEKAELKKAQTHIICIYIILCYYYNNTKVRAKQPKMCINCFISESACRIPFYQCCHLLGNQTVCLHQRKSTRFWCDLVLPTGYNIAYCANGGRAVERRTVEGTVVQSHLPPLQNLGNFVHPTFVCIFQKRH